MPGSSGFPGRWARSRWRTARGRAQSRTQCRPAELPVQGDHPARGGLVGGPARPVTRRCRWPVPPKPVGGEALAGCGIVTAPDTPPLPGDVSAEAWLVADLDSGAVIAARDPHGRHRPASIIKVLVAMASLNALPPQQVGRRNRRRRGRRGHQGRRRRRRHLHRQPAAARAADALRQRRRARAGHAARRHAAGAGEDQRAGRQARRPRHPGGDAVGTGRARHEHLGLRHRPVLPVRLAEPDLRRHRRDPRPSTSPATATTPATSWKTTTSCSTTIPGALGGKTGYTDDAGQTFVGAANHNGRRLMAVLLHGTRQPIAPWEQAAHLLDYGFSTAAGHPGRHADRTRSLAGAPNRTVPPTGKPTRPQAAGLIPSAEALPVRVGVARHRHASSCSG